MICNVHSNNVNRTKSTVLVLVLKYRPWFKQSHDGLTFKAWPFTIVLWDCFFHLNQSWLQWKKLSNNLGWLICQYFLWAWFKDQLLKFVQWYVTQRLGSVCSIYKALKSIVEALLRHFYSYVGYKLRVHHFQEWWISTFYTRDHSIMSFLCTLDMLQNTHDMPLLSWTAMHWPWRKFSLVHRLLRFTCAISSISSMTVFLLQFKNFLSSNMRTGKFLKWYNFRAWTWSMRSSHTLVC